MGTPRLKITHKRVKKQTVQNDIVDGLGRSKMIAGQLQPILVDQHGNVVDGNHRLSVDPDWKFEKLDWVKTDKDRRVVKLHANYRRTVSHDELTADFIALAESLLRERIIDDLKDAASSVAKLVPYSERYVRKLLPSKYKRKEFSNINDTAQPTHLMTSKQEEEFISNSENASDYNSPSGKVLAKGILPVEWFNLAGSRCIVNWDEKKIWALPK